MRPTMAFESDERTLAMDQSVDDKDGSWGTTNGGLALKKGPWTSSEDAILVDYVKKYGEGNWNAVQRYSGLSRCGKSCRLRWANHLRPNLKKGAFSSEEEMLIVELHAKMGNKWARMAAHLPGRTDNEIKNYWNTRIKRRQRAGLPLYSSDLSMKVSQEGRHGSSFHGVNSGSEGFFSSSTCQFPDVALESLKANHGLLSYIPELADLSGSSLPMKSFGESQFGGQMLSTVSGRKRLREPTASLYSSFCGIPKDIFSSLHTYEDDEGGGERIKRSFQYSFPTDEDPENNSLPSFDGVRGDHSFSNGLLSSSKQIPEALKMELPSFQYPEAELGSSWDKSPSHPALLESVDGFTQCPSKSGKAESQCISPQNNGLLETLVYEAKTMSSAKNQSSDNSSNDSAMIPGDISSSSLDICKNELDEYGDPSSPLGHSATSIFNEHGRSSLDDQQHVVDISQAPNVKEEPLDQSQGPEREQETRSRCDYTMMTWPDTLLASSDWFGLQSRGLGCQASMSESIASLLGEDLSSDYEQTQTVFAYYSSSDQALDLGFSSYAWNMMPAACQMSELP